MKLFHLFAKQTGTRPVHVTIPKRYVYFWEIGHYLSERYETYSIDCLDLNTSIFDIGKQVLQEKPDLVVLLVRIENLKQTHKLASFLKKIVPSTKLLVYGDIVNLLPDLFKQNNFFDAVVVDGDWEVSIDNYARYLSGEIKEPAGVFVHEIATEFPGNFLKNDWMFPNVDEETTELYNKLNRKKQISFTVARGCPFNCRFCLSVKTFGIAERRKSVDEVLAFMNKNKSRFDSFKLFAPTFTLDKVWVKQFSDRIINDGLQVSWTATSRIDCLDDEEMIRKMAKSGCYKISVGIETINNSSKFLKKEFSQEQIERIAGYFNKYKITLKGLIMLGVPGQTRDDIRDLFVFMESNNIKIRPTSYSPLDELPDFKRKSLSDIEAFDKLTYYKYGVFGLSEQEYYRLILDPYSYRDILI